MSNTIATREARVLTRLSVALLGASVSACSGYFDPGDIPLPPAGSGPTGGGPVPPTEVCDAPTVVFQQSCAGAACHGEGSPFGAFADPASVEALVGTPSVLNPSCGVYIDPEDPLASLILTRVTGESTCGALPPMPLGAPPLSDDEIACLEDWLLQFSDS